VIKMNKIHRRITTAISRLNSAERAILFLINHRKGYNKKATTWDLQNALYEIRNARTLLKNISWQKRLVYSTTTIHKNPKNKEVNNMTRTRVKAHTRNITATNPTLKREETKITTPTQPEPTQQIPEWKHDKIFKVNNQIGFGCDYKRMRDGFNHYATLYINGIEKDKAKVHYINRTWETYDYQTVMQNLVEKTPHLTPAEKQTAQTFLKKDQTDYSQFRRTAAVAKLGEIFGTTQKEKNDWKARMLKAGLANKGLQMPEDWNTLTEEEKQKRLDAVIAQLEQTP